MDSNRVIGSIDKYFNDTLKDKFEYHENYRVTHDADKNSIYLFTRDQYPQLPKLLSNNSLKSNIENVLLAGFSAGVNNISDVKITLHKDYISITYFYIDNPYFIYEPAILAKLASEYDIFEIDELCRLNKKFVNVCRNTTFWWELFRLKYPEFYRPLVDLKYKNYNPEEVIKGLYYAINTIFLNAVQNPGKLRTSKRGNYKLIHKISYLKNKYPDALRYLIQEDIWELKPENIWNILEIYDYNKDNLDLIVYMIIKYELSSNYLMMKILLIEILEVKDGLVIVKRLEDLLREYNIELYPMGAEFFKMLSGNIISIKDDDNIIEKYLWALEKVDPVEITRLYLEHYSMTTNKN